MIFANQSTLGLRLVISYINNLTIFIDYNKIINLIFIVYFDFSSPFPTIQNAAAKYIHLINIMTTGGNDNLRMKTKKTITIISHILKNLCRPKFKKKKRIGWGRII